jgi:hypothetical protein
MYQKRSEAEIIALVAPTTNPKAPSTVSTILRVRSPENPEAIV